MKGEVSFLGFAFEGGFKLGFLKDILEDFENFKQNQVFQKLREELQKLIEEEEYDATRASQFFEALELLERHIPFDPLQEPPEELRQLELQNPPQNILLYIFLTGYHQGYFYRDSLKKVDELIKYHMGEDSTQPGNYHNTDLLFVSNKTLYVVDFKLAGAHKGFAGILVNNGILPYQVVGLPVNLSLGEFSFDKFVKVVLQVEDKIMSLKTASAELKGFLQILSYAVDYLSENPGKEVKEVCLSLLYPLAEPFVARFYLKGEDLSPYREKIKELYKKIKEKQWEYDEIDTGSRARKERLLKENEEKRRELMEEIRKREKEGENINPDDIDQCRKDVKEKLAKFVNLDIPVKALCLLHSAGSGKTSQTRKLILQSEGKHIVFYFATRRVLVEREYRALKEKKEEGLDIELVYEKKASEKKKKKVEVKGDTDKDLSPEEGIIRRTIKEIEKFTVKEPKLIWAFLTQQAIVGTKHHKESTARHIRERLLSGRIVKNYTFHFILDEFLGHQNGLFAIEELVRVIKEIKNKGGKANLYIFDANGYTPAILKKLLYEYKEFEVIPNAVILSESKEEEKFEYEGIPFFVYAKHGYPCPELRLKRKFMFLENTKKADEEIANKLTKFIKETFTDKDKSTALLFVQNKDHLSKLKERLKHEGFETLIATADSKKSQEDINGGSQDIILATSAISRGIDLSREHKPVNHIYAVIYHWGVEGNLVELIQAISRARGDERTETEPKSLYLVYPISKVDEKTLEGIKDYLDEEEKDEELIRLLYEKHNIEERLELDSVVSRIIRQFVKSSEGRVLVPVPSQHKTHYIPNTLSNVEAALSFLENVRELGSNKKIYELYGTLLGSISASAVDVDTKSYEAHFHPYLLFRTKLRVSFDGNGRWRAKNLFKEVEKILKEHNEDRTVELERIIEEANRHSEDSIPLLIPVYVLVLLKHFMKPENRVDFKVRGRIGRGGADVLMGDVALITKCYLGQSGEKEYACIPLTEDYPYTEVLSGRFVKFPIEFIKDLLEG